MERRSLAAPWGRGRWLVYAIGEGKLRDPIVAIALAGTSRQEQVNFATDTPVDALLAELPESEVERTFLLSAGAWAIYRQAGTQARQSTETCTTAGAEILRECSPEAALQVSRLL